MSYTIKNCNANYNVMLCCPLNKLCFLDIGGIDYHHCLNFLFIISVVYVDNLFSFLCCVFGGVGVAHLFSFLCCVFGGIGV